MPKFKTTRQISVEIDALTSIKPTVRHFSAFGDNHWEAIEAQITILNHALKLIFRGALTPTRLCAKADDFKKYDEAGDELDNTQVYDEAIAACDWVCGESDNATLVEGWKELVISQKRAKRTPVADRQSAKDGLDRAILKSDRSQRKTAAKLKVSGTVMRRGMVESGAMGYDGPLGTLPPLKIGRKKLTMVAHGNTLPWYMRNGR